MLHIERMPGEGIIIGKDGRSQIWVSDGRTKLSLDFPKTTPVDRAELWLAKRLQESGGRITSDMRPIIDLMQDNCPWQLERVDFDNGRLLK